MPTDIPVGAPIWADTVAPDLNSETAFYSALMGWSLFDSGERFGHYTEFCIGTSAANARAVGGIMPSPPDTPHPAPPRWTVAFHVTDCEAAAERASTLGGTVVEGPTPVADELVFANCVDPAGARFGLFEPRREHLGFKAYREPGAPVWFEYCAQSLSLPVQFYSELFGIELITPPSLGAGEPLAWAGFTVGGTHQFGGSHIMNDHERELGPRWSISFQVASADESSRLAVELGGSIVTEPFDVTGYRAAELTSPSGAVFGVMSKNE